MMCCRQSRSLDGRGSDPGATFRKRGFYFAATLGSEGLNMTELDRGLGKRWFEEVWNKRRREAIAEMLAPRAVLHEGNEECVGPEGFYPFFDRLTAAFSEFHVTVHETIADG